MAEVLSIISLISFIISGVCLAFAVFFCIKFRIPTVIGDLSGRTARKSIAKMRANNEKTGYKSYRSSLTNVKRGKLTENIPESEEFIIDKKRVNDNQKPETGILAENKADVIASDETELLDGNATTGLLIDEDSTVSLDITQQSPTRRTRGKKLKMLDEIMLIHTDEVIK